MKLSLHGCLNWNDISKEKSFPKMAALFLNSVILLISGAIFREKEVLIYHPEFCFLMKNVDSVY